MGCWSVQEEVGLEFGKGIGGLRGVMSTLPSAKPHLE